MAPLIIHTGTFYIAHAELAHLHTGGPVTYRLNPYVTVATSPDKVTQDTVLDLSAADGPHRACPIHYPYVSTMPIASDWEHHWLYAGLDWPLAVCNHTSHGWQKLRYTTSTSRASSSSILPHS